MRLLYKYIIVAFVAMIATSCVTNDGEERSTKELGAKIWNNVESDLNQVNGVFRDVVQLDYMMGIEDEAERKAYMEEYLPNIKRSGDSGRYLLTTNTQYNTRYTTTIETNDQRLSDGGTWHLSCSSGIVYDIDIAPMEGSDDSFVVTFNKLEIFESSGQARFEMSFTTDTEYNTQGLNGAIVEYSGEMVMVDPEASKERPLTLSTKVHHIEYREFIGYISGSLEIECRDDYYGTKDIVGVDIGYDPRRVIISCWGEQHKIFQ